MCATCVAQGIGYVGSALVGLQVMGARARARRRSGEDEVAAAPEDIGSADVPSASPDEACATAPNR